MPVEELLAHLRSLVGEARAYLSEGDFEASMARMRVAQDEISLHIIAISDA